MYYIGMIEDDEAEARSVMASLVINTKQLCEESFKLYDLVKKASFREELFEQILNDIKENNIQGLIVDYKLDTLDEVMEGIEVVKFMHQEVPEFPVIILTDVPEKSKENDKADPDKVYAKEIFMKPGELETQEMVYHIVRNLERYAKRRSELEIKREMLLEDVVNTSKYDDETYGKLLETERELSKYVPIEMTAIDKEYDIESMEAVMETLKECKSLLE